MYHYPKASPKASVTVKAIAVQERILNKLINSLFNVCFAKSEEAKEKEMQIGQAFLYFQFIY